MHTSDISHRKKNRRFFEVDTPSLDAYTRIAMSNCIRKTRTRDVREGLGLSVSFAPTGNIKLENESEGGGGAGRKY